jgi:excinuclease ABC subunit C
MRVFFSKQSDPNLGAITPKNHPLWVYMQNIKIFLQHLTTHPGVYQMLGEDGVVLYVGKARNLKKRLSSYFSGRQLDIKTLALLKHVTDIQVTITHSEKEALLLECNLIKKYKPHYNVLFRDDKSFPYILITDDHPYPAIDFYRGNKRTRGKYFGPYPDAAAVRNTIHLIQKLFGLRTARDRYDPRRTRPCLQYQIGMCSGACAGIISIEDYQHDVYHAGLFLQGKNTQILDELNAQMEVAAKNLKYELAARIRDQIAKIRNLQANQYISSDEGDADVIGFAMDGIVCIQLLLIRGGRILGSRAYFPNVPPHSTVDEILTSFITQHYLGDHKEADIIPKRIIFEKTLAERNLLMKILSEKAQHKVMISHVVRGERKKWLEIANKSAKQSVTSQILSQANMQERFAALQTLLQLKRSPTRIECFDISHTMGEATMASCVVFNEKGPLKSDYRRFNIKNITPGDDVAAMHQVVQRRYQRLQAEQAVLPDIILIDGGRTQLKAAEQIISDLDIQGVLLIGVAKGLARKPGLETLHILGRPALHLDSDSLALHLIQQIRDEAHRFAITGHRKQRDKKRHTSILELIPGIGAKRRREILRYFGGIQAINRASLEELTNVPGISQSLAKRIFEALHTV